MATFRCSMLPYRLVDQCRACSRNVRLRYVNAAGGTRPSECVRVVKTNGKRSLPAKRIYERGESEFPGDERKSLVPDGRLPLGECRQTRCHVAPVVCAVNEAAPYTALACRGEGIVRRNRDGGGSGGGGDGNGAQMLRA